MNKEEIEVFNYYKKETEKEEKFLKEINFKYGDKKYIQRYKNHKNILNIINKLQQENTQLKANWEEIKQYCLDEQIPEEYPEYNSYIEFSNSCYDDIYNKMEELDGSNKED